MEQLTGLKLGKEYNSTIYCHPTHLTYVQSVCLYAESLQWCLTLCSPVLLIHQAYLFMGFSRQYWSRLPFSTPGNLPNPGIKPTCLRLLFWQAGSLPPAPPGILCNFLKSVYFTVSTYLCLFFYFVSSMVFISDSFNLFLFYGILLAYIKLETIL